MKKGFEGQSDKPPNASGGPILMRTEKWPSDMTLYRQQ